MTNSGSLLPDEQPPQVGSKYFAPRHRKVMSEPRPSLTAGDASIEIAGLKSEVELGRNPGSRCRGKYIAASHSGSGPARPTTLDKR